MSQRPKEEALPGRSRGRSANEALVWILTALPGGRHQRRYATSAQELPSTGGCAWEITPIPWTGFSIKGRDEQAGESTMSIIELFPFDRVKSKESSSSSWTEEPLIPEDFCKVGADEVTIFFFLDLRRSFSNYPRGTCSECSTSSTFLRISFSSWKLFLY